MRYFPAEFEPQSFVQLIFPHPQSDWASTLKRHANALLLLPLPLPSISHASLSAMMWTLSKAILPLTTILFLSPIKVMIHGHVIAVL